MRLFAIDMDGTCLNGRSHISEKTIDALRRAAAAGIEIVPTTGRALTCLPHQLKGEKYIRYVISSNGAVVTDIKQREIIYQAMIPCQTATALLNECLQTNIGISLHAFNELFLQGKKLSVLGRATYGKDALSAETTQNILGIVQAHHASIEEIQLFYFKRKERDAAERIISKYPELTAIYAKHYVELISRETDKGRALCGLREYLGMEKNQIACIGDGQNDTAMFRESGRKFAVANAIPELKKMADRVVSSNEQDGVAEAIFKYLL